ncbi:unnamed protein product [Nyctereutes procyonoides]|uniref:(raccoon dog) hypothetical protein n=1 Tax=Nyctereutes procyonoides TaxID=34880 RepID=A0A812A0A7_NYCPR|nr:unnamed protein product [Nyctereutes procyonoides]
MANFGDFLLDPSPPLPPPHAAKYRQFGSAKLPTEDAGELPQARGRRLQRQRGLRVPPAAAGRGRRALGAPQRARGAPPPGFGGFPSARASPPSPSQLLGRRRRLPPAARAPRGAAGSSVRAHRGCAAGPRRVGAGRRPGAGSGHRGASVSSFSPRLAARCSGTWLEPRGAAPNASGARLLWVGEETEAQKGASSSSGVLCLLLTSMKLWHADLFVCK